MEVGAADVDGGLVCLQDGGEAGDEAVGDSVGAAGEGLDGHTGVDRDDGLVGDCDAKLIGDAAAAGVAGRVLLALEVSDDIGQVHAVRAVELEVTEVVREEVGFPGSEVFDDLDLLADGRVPAVGGEEVGA